MRSQIPKFRLPDEVIDEEVGYALSTGGAVRRRSGGSTASRRCSARASTPSSSAAARRAVAISRFPAARKPRAIYASASTGSPASSSGTRTRSGAGSSCSGGGNTAMDCCRSVASPRRRRRQGRRALGLRRDEGLRLGEGGRDCAKASRSSIIIVPKAFLHDSGQADGHGLREGRARRRTSAAGAS